MNFSVFHLKYNILYWAIRLNFDVSGPVNAYDLSQRLPNEWKILVFHFGDLGPVVQNVVSLTSSLRVILLTVLADSIHNILIFFAEKM